MSFGLLLVSLEQILVSFGLLLVSLEQILVSLEQILVSFQKSKTCHVLLQFPHLTFSSQK
ncbi:hypothetical protein [Peribacillus frigoritolerans]|uniref:hypothetical protein n=1 Tax=Peribacillus frigoritolerans TaxID=450367 RepID=UPI0024C0F32B|nr:hypothetical protein [Peribacillus frigoritolerans]WHX60793.1 hypothetical protein QNH33_19550 [Peribacillus frigoritolerans]